MQLIFDLIKLHEAFLPFHQNSLRLCSVTSITSLNQIFRFPNERASSFISEWVSSRIISKHASDFIIPCSFTALLRDRWEIALKYCDLR